MEISSNSGWGIVGTRSAMTRSVERAYEALEALQQGDVTSARMVDLMTSEHSFAANARVIRAEDEQVGFLLNVKR